MRKYRFSGVILFLILFSAVIGWTDTIHLKSGRTLEGRVVNENEQQYQIEISSLNVTLWIDRESVERIEVPEVPVPNTATPIPESTPIQESLPERPRLEILRTTETRETGERDRSGEAVRAASPNQASEQATVGTLIAGAEGVVEVRTDDGPWREAQIGSSIGPRDRVRTLENGRAELVTLFQDGSQARMRLMENTEVAPDPESKTSLNLSRGRLWSQTKAAEEAGEIALQVKSPNAVAAIRGRGALVCFEMRLDGKAIISLFSGEVRVEGTGGTRQDLRTLQMAVLDRRGSLERMEEVDPEQIKEWEGWSETFGNLALFAQGAVGPMTGRIVEAMTQQIEEEHEAYSALMDDANTMVMINQQADLLNRYSEAFTAFHRDMGGFPATESAFQQLLQNVHQDPKWKGPYFEGTISLPARDRWGTEIVYEVQHTPGGKPYLSLRSLGPNRKDDRGMGDDIRVIVRDSGR